MHTSKQYQQEIQELKDKLTKLEANNYLLSDAINRLPVSIYWKDKNGFYPSNRYSLAID